MTARVECKADGLMFSDRILAKIIFGKFLVPT